MHQTVLILYPAASSSFGLWRPHSTPEWVTFTLPDYNKADLNLLSFLDTFLKEQHITLKQITHIGVMAGPASYTQLRVFVATANALAWSLKLPLFGFDETTALPQAIPSLLTQAKVNTPIEPVYPSVID